MNPLFLRRNLTNLNEKTVKKEVYSKLTDDPSCLAWVYSRNRKCLFSIKWRKTCRNFTHPHATIIVLKSIVMHSSKLLHFGHGTWSIGYSGLISKEPPPFQILLFGLSPSFVGNEIGADFISVSGKKINRKCLMKSLRYDICDHW